MSRIFTSKFNPGHARWRLVVSPEGEVYAFPLSLTLTSRHLTEGSRQYLVGNVVESERSWTASGPSGLIYGTRFQSLASALDAIADEAELSPVP